MLFTHHNDDLFLERERQFGADAIGPRSEVLMARKLPLLNALRAFEVAARSANFTQAAKRL